MKCAKYVHKKLFIERRNYDDVRAKNGNPGVLIKIYVYILVHTYFIYYQCVTIRLMTYSLNLKRKVDQVYVFVLLNYHMHIPAFLYLMTPNRFAYIFFCSWWKSKIALAFILILNQITSRRHWSALAKTHTLRHNFLLY